MSGVKGMRIAWEGDSMGNNIASHVEAVSVVEIRQKNIWVPAQKVMSEYANHAIWNTDNLLRIYTLSKCGMYQSCSNSHCIKDLLWYMHQCIGEGKGEGQMEDGEYRSNHTALNCLYDETVQNTSCARETALFGSRELEKEY